MCGIIGAIVSDFSPERFAKANFLLSHRGPDSTGTNFDPKFNLYLGFSRLAIQDLTSAGNQPMETADGEIRIVFNGEIYNYKELRAELISLGYSFRSNTDTEVILVGYKCWGINLLLEKIDGMFSIALLDRKKFQLILIRDPFGIKPLFYSKVGNKFIFASEIKPILNIIGNYRIDKENLEKSIYFTSLPRNCGTNFQNINRILPGEKLTLDLRSMEIHKQLYFELISLINKDEYEINSNTSRKKLAKKIEISLLENVRGTLISDAKLGILFSGGLDSSIVARLSSISSGKLYKCFSFLNLDSKRTIRKFILQHKNELHEVELNNDETFENLGTLIYNLEDINKAEAWVLGKVCEAAKKEGFKSLLTGDGADELFAGYNDHSLFYLEKKIKGNKFFSKIGKFLRHCGLDKFSDFFPTLKPAGSDLMAFPLDYLINNGRGITSFDKSIDAYQFEKDSAVRFANALLYEEIQYWIERFMLRADRFSMINSVELRLPFLRRDIVKLALNIPFNKKIRLGIAFRSKRIYHSKILLRIVAKNINIPKLIVSQRKIGTQFSSHENIKYIFENWNFSKLENFLNINIYKGNNFKYPDRLMVSLLSGDIFIRIFDVGEDVNEINQKIRKIIHSKGVGKS